MTPATAPRLSVSTWSLHRALGLTYPDADGPRTAKESFGPGTVSLLEIPARIAAMGIRTLEICHFQIPSRDTAYLNELRGALDAAGVELFSVLIDAGDITHPDDHARDLAWIAGWVDTAGALGAKRARVIAGKQPFRAETLALSTQGLRELASRGQAQGVRVTTENWFDFLARPEHVNTLLDGLEGAVGLNLDFGNWRGPTKYADLAAIAPRAESAHAKCAFSAPRAPDADDYRRCLELCRAARFSGPYTLIYDGPDDNEWEGLALERELVLPYLAA
jgi:hypothetical protein